jgi:hypothetical protein
MAFVDSLAFESPDAFFSFNMIPDDHFVISLSYKIKRCNGISSRYLPFERLIVESWNMLTKSLGTKVYANMARSA